MSTSLAKRPGFLTRWAEADPFLALREEMEDLVTRFTGADKEAWLMPSLDVKELNGEVQVRMDAPGMKADEIEIDVNGDMLTISGERKEEKEVKGEKTHRVERRFGSFSRTVRLPCAVKQDKIEAQLHDGVLAIKAPKSEEAKGQKIKIKAT